MERRHQCPARGVQASTVSSHPARPSSLGRSLGNSGQTQSSLDYRPGVLVGSLGSKLCCHAFLRGSQPASALLYLAGLSHGVVATLSLQRNVPFKRCRTGRRDSEGVAPRSQWGSWARQAAGELGLRSERVIISFQLVGSFLCSWWGQVWCPGGQGGLVLS